MARRTAEAEGWPWQEPVFAKTYRTLVLLGARRWHVMTNANNRGGNVNVHIDDAEARVIAKGFAQR